MIKIMRIMIIRKNCNILLEDSAVLTAYNNVKQYINVIFIWHEVKVHER